MRTNHSALPLMGEAPLSTLVVLVALLLSSCPNAGNNYDFDGDGVEDAADCAPEDPYIYPGRTDVCCDGIDADCDGADGTNEICECGDDDDSGTQGDDDTSTGDDDTSVGDDDASPGDDDDTTPPATVPGLAHRLCGGAAEASDGIYSARLCTGPVEAAPTTMTDSIYTLRSRGTRFITPLGGRR